MPRWRSLLERSAASFPSFAARALSRLGISPAAGVTFTRSVYGPDLCATPGDRTFDLCVNGNGPFVADTIAEHDRAFLFLDFGANLGLFSLLADRNPLCRRVLAFEPLPAIFRRLQVNIAHNKAMKVEPVCAAVTDRPKRFVRLSFNPRHSGMSRIVDRRRNTIRARTIDAPKLTQLVPAWPESILAKIDVEGGEAGVLSVLRGTPFYGAVTDIVIEVSIRNLGQDGRRGLIGMLEADGYSEIGRRGREEHYDAHYRRST